MEGFRRIYKKDGSLWAEINYKHDEAVSGKCANGRTLNNAEIHNFNKGLKVNCGY